MLHFQALAESWDRFNSRGHNFYGLLIILLAKEKEANIIIQEGFCESTLTFPEITAAAASFT